MKHTGLSKKQGYAIRKVTKKSFIDWKHLGNRFSTYRDQIKAHKHDQEYLLNLKERLERKFS